MNIEDKINTKKGREEVLSYVRETMIHCDLNNKTATETINLIKKDLSRFDENGKIIKGFKGTSGTV